MGRKIVLAASFIVAVIAFAAVILFHRAGIPIPLWDKVAMAYGGVFCIFWLFDTAAKRVAKQFAKDDEEPVRPTPRPASDPRERAVLAGGANHRTGIVKEEEDNAGVGDGGQTAKVVLERVRDTDAAQWQEFLDRFAEESLALDGIQPEVDKNGHVRDWSAQDLVNRQGAYSFWIQRNGQRVGTISARVLPPVEAIGVESTIVDIGVVYVESAWRRQEIGSEAMDKLVEFLLLLQPSCTLRCVISKNNYRGRRYLQACHFAEKEPSDMSRQTLIRSV